MDIHNLPLVLGANALPEGIRRYTLFMVTDDRGGEKYITRFDKPDAVVPNIISAFEAETGGFKKVLLSGGRFYYKPNGKEVIELFGECSDIGRIPERPMLAALLRRHFTGFKVISHELPH